MSIRASLFFSVLMTAGIKGVSVHQMRRPRLGPFTLARVSIPVLKIVVAGFIHLNRESLLGSGWLRGTPGWLRV